MLLQMKIKKNLELRVIIVSLEFCAGEEMSAI